MNRVVITGLGAVTAIGHTVSQYWNGLISGQSGVQNIDTFDVSQFSTRFAAQVRGLDFEAHFDKKEIRKTSRFILFALLAAQEAVKDSGLQIALNPERVGVEIGSGIVEREIRNLDKIMTVAKSPHIVILGGSKIFPITS